MTTQSMNANFLTYDECIAEMDAIIECGGDTGHGRFIILYQRAKALAPPKEY